MTREEAIEEISYYCQDSEEIIKVLRQEPILDKIRAEIEQDAFEDVNGSKYIFVNRVIQIIDKYKAESEE